MVTLLAEKRYSAKLEKLQLALAERDQKLTELDGQLENLIVEEDAAVAESLRAVPGESAYRLGSKAQLARDKREKLARSREGLEKEASALRAEINLASTRDAEAELKTLTKEAKRINTAERDRLSAASTQLAALAEVWNSIAVLREQRSELERRVTELGLLSDEGRVRFFYPEAAAEWGEADQPPFAPLTVDFAGFVEQLVEASLDYDETNPAFRETGLPDLRSAVKAPTLSGPGLYVRQAKRQAVRPIFRDDPDWRPLGGAAA